MSVIHLSGGETLVAVAPEVGGRVASITHRGVDLLVGPDHSMATDPRTWGCYPMVPWCGRIANGRFNWKGQDIRLDLNSGPHAIHGTVFSTPWSVNGVSKNHVEMSCSIARRGWPFEGVVKHAISVEEGHVSLSLEVTAHEAMPVQVGWHPWFVKPASVGTTFTSMYVRADDYSTTAHLVQPTGPPWDDCFTGGGVLPFTIDDVSVRLESSCDHWVIYDMPNHATCIESQSGPPNGVNIGQADVVQPGKPMQQTFDLFFE